MIEVTIVGIACLVAFLFFEVFIAKLQVSGETLRKLAHIVIGASIAILPFWFTRMQIAIIALLVIPIVIISMRRQIFKSLHQVGRKTYGELFFPIGIFLSSLLFPQNVAFMYAMLVIGVADALASLAGKKYGKVHFSLLGSHKSYAGSVTFFVTTAVIGALLIMAFTPATVAAVIGVSVAAAALLTFLEAASTNGIDNLLVPLAAGGLMVMAINAGFLG